MKHLINISSLNSPKKYLNDTLYVPQYPKLSKNEPSFYTYSNPNHEIFSPIIPQHVLIKNMKHLINISSLNSPKKYLNDTLYVPQYPKLSKNEPSFYTYSNPNHEIFAPIIPQHILIKNMKHLINISSLNSPKKYLNDTLYVPQYPKLSKNEPSFYTYSNPNHEIFAPIIPQHILIKNMKHLINISSLNSPKKYLNDTLYVPQYPKLSKNEPSFYTYSNPNHEIFAPIIPQHILIKNMKHLINISSLNSPKKYLNDTLYVPQYPKLSKNEPSFYTYSNPNHEIFSPIIPQHVLIKNMKHLINISSLNSPKKYLNDTLYVPQYPKLSKNEPSFYTYSNPNHEIFAPIIPQHVLIKNMKHLINISSLNSPKKYLNDTLYVPQYPKLSKNEPSFYTYSNPNHEIFAPIIPQHILIKNMKHLINISSLNSPKKYLNDTLYVPQYPKLSKNEPSFYTYSNPNHEIFAPIIPQHILIKNMKHLINISSLNSPKKYLNDTLYVPQYPKLSKNEPSFYTYSNPNHEIFSPIIPQHVLIKNMKHLINISSLNSLKKYLNDTLYVPQYPKLSKNELSFYTYSNPNHEIFAPIIPQHVLIKNMKHLINISSLNSPKKYLNDIF